MKKHTVMSVRRDWLGQSVNARDTMKSEYEPRSSAKKIKPKRRANPPPKVVNAAMLADRGDAAEESFHPMSKKLMSALSSQPVTNRKRLSAKRVRRHEVRKRL